MTSKLDPQELERLSKAAEQEDDDVRYYGGPTSTHRPARDAYHAALADLYHTGQLVPAMPSGDVVEAVAMALAEFECANWDAQSFNETPAGETPDEMRQGYLAKATAAITTYEAISGVAKMRDALECADTLRKAIRDAGIKRTPGIYEAVMRFDAARAALGEKP